MIIKRKKDSKARIRSWAVDSKEGIKIYSIDKENNHIQLELSGESLYTLETEYEVLCANEPEKLKHVDQHFVMELNLDDYRDRKFSIITDDMKGNVIHIEKEIVVKLSIQELNRIYDFLKENKLQ